MRPVDKKIWTDTQGNPYDRQYNPYGSAKDDLIANLGKYCSFCEVPVPPKASLQVEHVKSKKKYAHLMLLWSNFLLGCNMCNPIKGEKDFEFNEIHLPHLNNTFLSFEIRDGGLVIINPNLPPEEKSKAEKLSSLTGIERRPGMKGYSRKKSDDRWQNRYEAWNKANMYLQKHIEGIADAEIIVHLAVKEGFFSVWMTVFKNEPTIKLALIEAFPGTAKNCFDADGNPVPRNGKAI